MLDDLLARWIILLGMLTVGPVGVWYRIRSDSGERLDRRQEGLFLLIGIRAVAAAAFGLIVAFLIRPELLRWSHTPVPPLLRWAGVPLAAFGAGLVLWTFHTLGPNLTDTVVTRRTHTLVTSGPFRFVRHPLYVAAAVLAPAMALLTANWAIGLLGGVVFVLLALRTRIEERNLIARFGDAYRAYARNTGRFLPRITPR